MYSTHSVGRVHASRAARVASLVDAGSFEECDRGLRAVFDQIRRRGMQCGLWVEIERMVPTSRIAQEHPEWFIQRRGVKTHQLDLAQPEVEQHVYETIARLVDTYALDCFRLDYNISMMEGGDRQ